MARKKDFLASIAQRKRIDNTLVHIDAELDNRIGLADLSDISCYSPFHFQRKFTETVGETWYEFTLRHRLQKAANRLTLTPESLNDISYLAGFQTPTGFIKAFKKFSGLTPKKFRTVYTGEFAKALCPLKKKRVHSITPDIYYGDAFYVQGFSGKGMVNAHFDSAGWIAINKLLKQLIEPLLSHSLVNIKRSSVEGRFFYVSTCLD